MLIELNNVNKSYIDTENQLKKSVLKRIFSRKMKKLIIDDLSFNVNSGEIVGYIGENGAGKSTTIKMILGIMPPDSGSIMVFNKFPFISRKKNALNIGVLFGQKSHLWWDLPLIDSFYFLQKIYKKYTQEDKEWLNWLIEELEVKEFVEQPVRELSLGQRMRAEFICSILHSPKLVVLDEPTIGLDVKTKQKLMEIILKVNQAKGTTFLITSHDFQEIEKVCNRIILLSEGKNVFDGTVSEYKNRYSFYRKVTIETVEKFEYSLSELKLLTENISSKEYYFDERVISEEQVRKLVEKMFGDKKFVFAPLTFSEIVIITRR
ncbi:MULTISPECIES: ATP-binding cassette domain-containing protein [unclassified Facklamia]|uniref:ABC transporter ATP-binding protein n=1 Tax=Aerococcaceae TaxID=186827 RepID=UPI0013D36002|nr:MULTISPECIES: ATP-binding cassette domain-containing protein [unclassified Facklamia]QQD66356.1 ATP-binding cassette domain-containing protein [Aerococcaceae bacterium zg-252]